MSYTVVGLFESENQTQHAVTELGQAGFSEGYVDVSPYRLEGDYDKDDYDYDRDEKNEGFWDWLFGDDDDEKYRYSKAGSRSHLVTIHTNSMDEAEKARRVLDNAGALDVNECNARFDAHTTDNLPAETAAHIDGDQKISVVEEDMDVTKREVADSKVQIRSRIIEKPVEESVRLREERVYVRRQPVNRPATEADFNTFKEGTIEMTETHEEAVINKNAKVVEEITVDKDVEVETETVRDTVRETKVDVERVEYEKERRSSNS